MRKAKVIAKREPQACQQGSRAVCQWSPKFHFCPQGEGNAISCADMLFLDAIIGEKCIKRIYIIGLCIFFV